MGVCAICELEEKLKSFRLMNQSSVKKRYLLARESLASPEGKPILKKGMEIDLPSALLLKRYYDKDQYVKTFQPDEGIAIVSDMSHPQGISFTMDIVTQILNVGGGVYEGFTERVDSFGEFLDLLKKVLFPRVILIGYLSPDRIEVEKINFVRARRVDQFIRVIEMTHSVYKKEPYFPKIPQLQIDPEDPRAWGRLILEVVKVYTQPYFLEAME